MSLPTSLRRATAVLTTTALMSVAGLAGGALLGVAHAEDVISVTPNSTVNNGTKAITINGAGFGASSGVKAVLHPTFIGAEVGDLVVTLDSNTASLCALQGSCTTLTGTVPLLSAAPGTYDLVLTKKGAPADEVDTCSACFVLQTANDPTVTRVAASDNGDGSLSIVGSNFANGATVAFLKADGKPDQYISFVPGGTPDVNTGLSTTAYPSANQIFGVYTASPGVTPGAHLLKVINTDGSSGPGLTSTTPFTQPVITAVVPSSLGQGAKNFSVTINGSGFHPTSTVGITNPSTADVTLAGPPVIKADGTQIVVPLTATPTASLTFNPPRTLTVRGADGDFTTAGLPITVSPKWTASVPGSRGQGSTGTVTMTGTGFVPGVTFSFGPGIVATTVSATATSATLTVVVDPSAATGGRNIVVTNPDGGTTTGAPTITSPSAPFTVNARPQVTSLSPASSAPGTTANVTLSGSGLSGSSVVTVGDPGGITITNIGAVSGGLVARFATSSTAITGARDITVTNPDGGTFLCTSCFGVNSLSVTSSSAVTDSTASRSLTFTGPGLSPSTKLTLYRHGRPDYQAPLTPTAGTTPVLNADGTLTATFAFIGAAPGQYDAEAVTSGGSLLCTSCFLVASSVQPSVSSVAPTAGGQGARANTVVITGTGFTKGMVATLGSGVTTTATTYNSPTQLTATLAIDPAAGTGTRNVTVTAGDGTSASLANGYTITIKPSPSTVSPTTRGQGYSGDVTVTGLDFVDGAKISFGTGITAVVKSIAQGNVASATDTLVATLTIAQDAPSGTHDVTITNPDGGLGVCTACFTVTVGPGLTGVSPATIAPDANAAQTVDKVILTGVLFTGTPVVVIQDVTVNNIVVATGGSTLSASFTVAKAAAPGARTVTVTNPDGGTSTCTTCFYIATIPGAPASVTVTPADSSATVTWTAPTNTGGAPITKYSVQAGVGGPVQTVDASVATVTFTKLTNGKTYAFSVQARNLAGIGPSTVKSAVVNPASATPTPAPTTPSGPSTVTLSGPAVVHPSFNRIFFIEGTAPIGASVDLHFRKSDMATGVYGIVRTVISDSNGNWTRQIKANVDYRYYATVGTDSANTSTGVLNQPQATVDGPYARTVAKNQSYALTGTSVPGSTVYIHFHKGGTPANDYSIVRSVTADASGNWSRSFVASTDYRLYVSRAASDSSGDGNYLFQAR